MSQPDDEIAKRRGRRIRAALLMGFTLVFVFAVILQLTADFVGWVTSTRVTFLFPLGLKSAFTHPEHLVNVIFGLVLTAFGVSAFLYWRMHAIESRRTILHSLEDQEPRE